jgi:hypothetical protein
VFVELPQWWPHAPQLLMSLSSSTHWPLQHVWSGPQGFGHEGPPVELEAALELVPLLMQQARHDGL